MKILIVSDAWYPQVNGVVRTLDTIRREVEKLGHEVHMITPDQFRTFPCPTYPEIRLALFPKSSIARAIDESRPDAIHIATEGPLGQAARRVCLRRKLPFTTAYHTRFPEYIQARFRIPLSLTYRLMRRFHAPSRGIMVATPSVRQDLETRSFAACVPLSRGVDLSQFKPGQKGLLDDQRPILLYVGRVAVEKNLDAFLSLDTPGTKYVVGDGPSLEAMREKYTDVRFLGARHGEDLAAIYAAADVFVFPSLTDTFGLVLLEALASGLPIAAYPVAGPKDVLAGHYCSADKPDPKAVGCLDNDLGRAIDAALTLSPERCLAYARTFSWERVAQQFVDNLALAHEPASDPLPALEAGERSGVSFERV
ncbi:MAG TPA: glycosyltransferase family 1 protein [Alphaproteobacteria bacterium]|nr:glycosyltransferase family 1 protein [Alphaproteobacteria bacterium]